MPARMPEAGPQGPASPPGELEKQSYVVQSGETITAIAAKFDITPSELARLNRISAGSVLFPGRKLSIPVKKKRLGLRDATDQTSADQQSQTKTQSCGEGDGAPESNPSEGGLPPEAANERYSEAKVPINDYLASLMMPPRLGGGHQSENFMNQPVRGMRTASNVLKINARHITDGQGVVTGTLLVTPNNIMFSPNVSDLIVIEHGTEHYEVTAPIDMIAGAALYTDIAIMRTKHHHKPIVCNIPVQVYYSEEKRPITPPSSPNRNCDLKTSSDSGSEPVSPRPTKTPPSSPIVGGGGRQDVARADSRDMDEPEVFAALEKLIPRPAQPQESSMLYLCLRMGKPINKQVKMSAVSTGRRKLRCEYWFGIPRQRVDEVYKFFQRNYPEKYGDVIEVDMKERGFEDISSEDDESEEEAKSETPKSSTDGALTGVLNRVGSFKNPFKLPRFFEGPNTPHPSFSSCEWEVIALKDDTAPPCSNLLNPLTPDEIVLPEMVDESEILEEEHRKMLYKVIPARAEGYAWRLVYSTQRNGFSLKTFYREMNRHDGPVLIAMTDTGGALFGAFASTPIHPSDHFYGTGETFLFSFHPSFNKYSWTGENQYFIKGNADSLVFGSGDGEFGLYLDGDLYHGRSSVCKTFNNDVLSKSDDFVIKSLEAWGFF